MLMCYLSLSYTVTADQDFPAPLYVCIGGLCPGLADTRKMEHCGIIINNTAPYDIQVETYNGFDCLRWRPYSVLKIRPGESCRCEAKGAQLYYVISSNGRRLPSYKACNGDSINFIDET